MAVESLGGIRTVRSFAAEKKEVVRYRDAMAASLELAFKRINLSATFFGVAFFAAFTAGVFVFWYGARMVAAGDLSPGNLISFLFNTMQMAASLAALEVGDGASYWLENGMLSLKLQVQATDARDWDTVDLCHSPECK